MGSEVVSEIGCSECGQNEVVGTRYWGADLEEGQDYEQIEICLNPECRTGKGWKTYQSMVEGNKPRLMYI